MRLTAPTTLLTLCALATASESIHAQAGIDTASGSSKRKAPITAHLARRLLPADRVGSLTVGKDADFLVTAGDPLDPRVPPSKVYIEGQLIHRLGDVR